MIEKEAFVSRATFHILNGVKYFFDKEFLLLDAKDLSLKEKQIEKQKIYEAKGSDFTEKSINLVYEVVETEMSTRGDEYTHDKFFKEIPTNNIIRTHILTKINSEP